MEDVLAYVRVHRTGNWVRGWYFPETWADPARAPAAEDDDDEEEVRGDGEGRRPAQARERVVVIEAARGVLFSSIGRHVSGAGKDQAGGQKLWLLPEEALFLVERGSLDLWWPSKPIEELFPAPAEEEEGKDGGGREGEDQVPPMDDDDYDTGVPLSLQAAYSLLIGHDGERGKISLQKYQVYANLKRNGYHVLRAASAPRPLRPSSATTHGSPLPKAIWPWLFSFLFSSNERERTPPPRIGPLVRPGFYRSYKSIYEQINIIPRHKPVPDPPSPPQPRDPFRIHFHVWRSGVARWSKARPPPPDFYLAATDAQASGVPTMEQITALLEAAPWAPPDRERFPGPGGLYPRLKHGYHNVLVAVVDHGVVNYMRFADGAFGEETLWQRFDADVAPEGRKRGGGRPRGGRGGKRGARGK